MLYPAAGTLIWIVLGAIIGWMAGKLTNTSTSNGLMANLGVGAVSAVIAGFATTFFFRGEPSDNGFWAALLIAAGTAIASVALFRMVFPSRIETLH
jgi:uncharacterized membrane protein YeaQ/YmgE (transglycosylase-associated protein family)